MPEIPHLSGRGALAFSPSCYQYLYEGAPGGGTPGGACEGIAAYAGEGTPALAALPGVVAAHGLQICFLISAYSATL